MKPKQEYRSGGIHTCSRDSRANNITLLFIAEDKSKIKSSHDHPPSKRYCIALELRITVSM